MRGLKRIADALLAKRAKSANDNPELAPYRLAMDRGDPFIRMTLHVDQPIELADFVGAFTALGYEYARFAQARSPGSEPRASLLVRQVRAGSIEADLVPWVAGGAMSLIGAAANINTLIEFVGHFKDRLGVFLKSGGRLPDASQRQLRDLLDQTAAIAKEPGSRLRLAAIEQRNGADVTRGFWEFGHEEARTIQAGVEAQRNELSRSGQAQHQQVLMTFVRSDIRDVALGKRSGEQVVIDEIDKKPRPLIYASGLAEARIKSEIKDEDSVYGKGFVVDVSVLANKGKPVAYIVTNLHQVIPLDDEDGEEAPG